MKYSYIVTINSDKCVGCRICEMVCSFSHTKEFNPTKARIRVIRNEKDGIISTVPVFCQQCETPVCMNLCPANAIQKDVQTNAKIVNEKKCLGCRRCSYVCPFGAISVCQEAGVAIKCDLCEGKPLCVQFCPFDALKYIRTDKFDITQKRRKVQAVLNFQKELEE